MNSLWSDLFISYSLFLLNQTILSTLLEIVIESCHSSSIRNIPKLLKTYLIQLARYLDSTSKLLGNFLFVTKGPREQWHASSCIPNVDPRGRTPQEYGTIEMDKWIMWKDVKNMWKSIKDQIGKSSAMEAMFEHLPQTHAKPAQIWTSCAESETYHQEPPEGWQSMDSRWFL